MKRRPPRLASFALLHLHLILGLLPFTAAQTPTQTPDQTPVYDHHPDPTNSHYSNLLSGQAQTAPLSANENALAINVTSYPTSSWTWQGDDTSTDNNTDSSTYTDTDDGNATITDSGTCADAPDCFFVNSTSTSTTASSSSTLTSFGFEGIPPPDPPSSAFNFTLAMIVLVCSLVIGMCAFCACRLASRDRRRAARRAARGFHARRGSVSDSIWDNRSVGSVMTEPLPLYVAPEDSRPPPKYEIVIATEQNGGEEGEGRGQDRDQGRGQDRGQGRGQDRDQGRGQDRDQGRGQDRDQGRSQGRNVDQNQGRVVDQGEAQGKNRGEDQDESEGGEREEGGESGYAEGPSREVSSMG